MCLVFARACVYVCNVYVCLWNKSLKCESVTYTKDWNKSELSKSVWEGVIERVTSQGNGTINIVCAMADVIVIVIVINNFVPV